MVSLILAVLLGLVIYAYYFVLPARNDEQYLKTIRPAYSQQYAQMSLTYKSLDEPVFTRGNTSPTTVVQDLAYINTTIKNAIALTDTLDAKNNLTVLPGTERFTTVSQTSRQYNAMQQYVNDSRTFLVNYQDDSTYISQLEHIENSAQLTVFFDAMSTVDKATTATQLLDATKNASADLANIIASLNLVVTPVDFRQNNTALVANLSSANNAFIDIISGINNEGAEQVANTISSLNQAANAVHGFASTDVGSAFRYYSVVYQEMTRLKSEYPLYGSKS
jgi:endonuclease YncB( thermonuclease family)